MGVREALSRAPAWVRWLLALIPLRVALIPVIPILPEEAYHWNFARHLDWSYYDHPPMIAWAIAAGRLLFGDTPFGIRFVPLLFSIGTSILLARLARRFYGDAAAVWTLLLFTFEPVALPVSEAGWPDSPLLFFWALTMTWLWDAMEQRCWGRWLLAGAALGGAMLSKYTAAFLVPSVLLYLLLSSRDRRWLATPWPYLAGVAALVVFTPVIYWNWKHEWASFLFQSRGRLQESRGFDVRTGFRYVWGQALAFFALTLPLMIAALVRMARTKRPEEAFFRALLLPIVLFFWAISFIHPAHVLWPMPAWLGLVVVMSGAVVDEKSWTGGFYGKWRTGFLALSLLALVGSGIHLKWFLPYVSPMQGLYGWEQVAARAREVKAPLPPSAFYLALGRKYTCTSQLAYQLSQPYDVFGAELMGETSLQYAYWIDPRSLRGRDAVVVIEGDARARQMVDDLRARFESVESAGVVTVRVGRRPILETPPLTFEVFRARGYRPPERR